MSTDRPLVYISAETFREVVPMAALIEAMRSVYAAQPKPAAVPPRSVARGDKVWLRSLSAILPTGKTMGAKVFASARVRGVAYLIALFDQERGDLVALLDAKEITAMRTAAVSALAADCLAPDAPAVVGMIGSGMEAQSHLQALAEVRRISDLRVFSPTPQNRERFAETAHADYGIRAAAFNNPEAVVRGASIVVCAARSRDETPVFDGDWLAPDATVVSVGSTLPEQREVDAKTIARADLIVADSPEEVTEDTGDFLAARAAGVDFQAKVCSLGDLVSGHRQRATGSLALYKSVGSGLQDIAAAELAYLEATKHGVATPLPVALSVKRTPR